jgi:hypothetical protein
MESLGMHTFELMRSVASGAASKGEMAKHHQARRRRMAHAYHAQCR